MIHRRTTGENMSNASEQPIAYSVGEVARLVGVSRSKIYELLRAGRLPSLRIGDRRLVRRSAIEAFLASLESPADEADSGPRRLPVVDDVAANAAGRQP